MMRLLNWINPEYVPDMLEHGRPVRREYPADEPIPYAVTPDGRKILRGVAAPIYDDAPGKVEAVGWDANGSPVEGEMQP